MYIDSHCHLEIEKFDKDRDQVISKSLAEGLIYILTVGTEEQYFGKVVELVDMYPEIYGAVGIHPHNAKDYTDQMAEKLRVTLTHPKIVALGEIGLDFFKNHSPRSAQLKTFEGQMELACREKIPVIIHSRSAQQETLTVLKKFVEGLPAGGVIHCFSYDLHAAKEFLDLGFFLSIPGTITYTKNTSLIDAAKYIPLDRILIETDAPFLAPVPHRGKRNLPHLVKIIAESVAQIKNMTVEDLSFNVRRNFETLFLPGSKEAPH
ncbi:MAG: TatD family hydrolase [Syntrophobacterales bacterium]|jgi:TatD DNase family protein|nr:TatD family hydrolase [Syntrophobacterales bacterium]